VPAPAAPPLDPATGLPPVAAQAAAREHPALVARATLLDALYKDLGQAGSLVQTPQGEHFELDADRAEGSAHAPHGLRVPLPHGGSVPHQADLAVHLEDGRLVYVDILDTASRLQDFKAAAFDAQHLKAGPKKVFAALVLVRLDHATITQDLVESLAHSFDWVFGVDAANVSLGAKFAALRADLARKITGGA
jgi:hypothetical protein